jgi:hypothetical protein
MTLIQNPQVGEHSSLAGFVVVTSGCEPGSHALSGSVSTSGVIEFTSDAPEPGWPFCPNGMVHYEGQVSTGNSGTSLSMRGRTTGVCSTNRNPFLTSPGFTQNEFTYVIDAVK